MTIFEFFYNQTTKQIKECFRKAGIEKHGDLPDDVKSFCYVFGLEPDNRIKLFSVHHQYGKGFITVSFSVPNSVFPDCPIDFWVNYSIKSCKGACSITLFKVFFNDSVDYFKEISDLYDKRPKYNNIECSVSLSQLGDVFADGIEQEDFTFAKTLTIKDVYDAIMKYAEETKPYIDKFMQNTKDGSYETLWNKYSPKDPFVRGDAIFKLFAPSQLRTWMFIERSGHKMSLDEFVLMNVATEKRVLGDRTGEVYSYDVNTRVKACLDLIDAYKNKYVEDTSFNDWCELYEKAYHEMRKRYAEERERISKELGINQKYVGVFCKRWPQNYVPEDAYDLDWRDENWKE